MLPLGSVKIIALCHFLPLKRMKRNNNVNVDGYVNTQLNL